MYLSSPFPKHTKRNSGGMATTQAVRLGCGDKNGRSIFPPFSSYASSRSFRRRSRYGDIGGESARVRKRKIFRVEAAGAASSSSKNIDETTRTNKSNNDKQVRTFYTFKPGETVEMLSEYVGVDVEALKALNPGVDLDFVFPGDRVVVHVERQREQERKEVKDEEVRKKVATMVDARIEQRQQQQQQQQQQQRGRRIKEEEKQKRAARMEEERNNQRRREKEAQLLKKAEKEQQQSKTKKQVQVQAMKKPAPVFNAGAAMFVASVPALAISTRLGYFNPVLDAFGKV